MRPKLNKIQILLAKFKQKDSKVYKEIRSSVHHRNQEIVFNAKPKNIKT